MLYTSHLQSEHEELSPRIKISPKLCKNVVYWTCLITGWLLGCTSLSFLFASLVVCCCSWLVHYSGQCLQRFQRSIDRCRHVRTGQIQVVWNTCQVGEDPLPKHDAHNVVHVTAATNVQSCYRCIGLRTYMNPVKCHFTELLGACQPESLKHRKHFLKQDSSFCP